MTAVLRFFLACSMLSANLVLAAEFDVPESVIRQVARILEQVDDDPQAAIDALAELVERRRRSADVRAYIVRQKAALLIRENQLETAREDLHAALAGQADGFGLSLRLMLGQTLLMLDRYEQGVAELERWAGQFDTPDPSGLFLLGYGYLRQERFEQAVGRLEDAMAGLAESPRNHWIELLAYAYARAGRPGDAQRLIEELIARQPGQARWWRQLAAVLLLIEDTQRGTAAMSVAEQIQPESFEQTRRLARFLSHAGMPADGAALLAAAIGGESPASAEDHLLLAEMWVLAREFDEAVAALEQAQALAADDGKPALVLGQLYLHWERYEDARTALERAAAAYGRAAPAQVHYLLAITYINLDLEGLALAALDRLGDDAGYAARGAALERYIANLRQARQADT